ncbi:SDR family NAD(P)-dependent oxidoreductase [Caulobacter sp. KR2-114]|jgi:short-subunit dehydrogenase|uniref:SDR family NAD(P)-dependent oxidoreductase n=1 Tax=Caulobacter sp. KR2-114 TaxID=3400912 RepID=UPI003C06986A
MSDVRISALITGASSGIGAVYADRLAARGYDLILVARRRDRLEALAARLRQDYGRVVEVEPADLRDPEDLARIEALVRSREDIGVLVNNAGLGAGAPSVSADPEAVETLVKINVLALTLLCLAATPRFAARDDGLIINIASIIAVIPSATAAAYSGSKAYVLNFSRSLQSEFAKTNVKVQVVLPGPVRTEFFGDRPPPFPDHLFMSPETLVDVAFRALDQGEMVCWPTLHDPQAWTSFDEARRALSKAVSQDAVPPERYGLAAPIESVT